MQMVELAVWSAATGAIGLVVLAGLADYGWRRHIAALHGVSYNVGCLAFVVLLSGLAGNLVPRAWADETRIAQLLVGPVVVCMGDLWLRAWFGARSRDRLMDLCLLAGGIAGPVLGIASMWVLHPQWQLPLAAAIVVLNTVVVIWMSTRAWLLGDPLAPGMTLGAFLMLTSTVGLYAIALGVDVSMAGHVFFASASSLCVAVVGAMLWKRNQRHVHVTQEVHSQNDAVTKLPSGTQLVRNLLRAQRRRRISRREGAVIAVIVFEPDRIRNAAGTAGLNEAYMHLAQRLQHQVGVVNPVGRYWDRCFIALMEAIHSPTALRTVGLRVATSLRRPMQVTAADGSQVQVRFDIGVGVLRLRQESEDVEDLLHDAQHLAKAARMLPSRAATRDSRTGDVVAVEHAHLGPRARPRTLFRMLTRQGARA